MINTNRKQYIKNGVIYYTAIPTINEFSELVGMTSAQIIKKYFMKGVMLHNNSTLTLEQFQELAIDNKLRIQKDSGSKLKDRFIGLGNNKDVRAPIVTIMGHVDHGKTTLLDTILKTAVVKGEAGGITQHIGAYEATYQGKKITFIDTPGHAAFSAMRLHGGMITDFIILVVAANEGLKPQTLESIKVIKESGAIPIVFVNKTDLPNIDVNKVLGQLSEQDLTPIEWGGDTPTIQGSALKGTNVDKLLKTILDFASEYGANLCDLSIPGVGAVLESTIKTGIGKVATIVLKNGKMNVGDFVTAGLSYGTIKMIVDPLKKNKKTLLAGEAAEISGLNELPGSGEFLQVYKNKKDAEAICKQIDIDLSNASKTNVLHQNLDNKKAINLLIKTDTHGSLEAIKNILNKFNTASVQNINIVRTGVGQIIENDINIASSAHSYIVGFNVKPNKQMHELATKQGVKILFYNIVYKIEEDMDLMLKKNTVPEFEEKETGEAKILQLWKHSAVGTIAGCKVVDGEINRNDMARVLRKGVVLHSTKIGSLKHVKENINKATNGMEFGITLTNFNDLQVGDIIQSYKSVKVENAKEK